jgi:hypothetical protein
VKDLRGIGLEADRIWRLFMPVMVFKSKQSDILPSIDTSATGICYVFSFPYFFCWIIVANSKLFLFSFFFLLTFLK